MKKLKIIIHALLILVCILFLVSFLEAAPAAPTNFTAVNFGGPIRLSWTASAGATSYNVYRSTSSNTPPPTNPPVAPYSNYELIGFGITSTFYVYTSVSEGEGFYYFVTAVNSDPVPESTPASNYAFVESNYPEPGTAYSLNLTATTQLIDYENSTLAGASTNTVITYQIADTDINGNRWVASQILYDIKYNGETSIFKEPPQVISGGSSGISTGQIIWDGRWLNTKNYTKHNGSYTVEVWAKDFAGNEGPKSTITISVHVVHVNDVIQTFTDYGQTTIAHSLPINFSYQLTHDAWTTISIYNTNGTDATADDTLIKSFTYASPRNSEGLDWDFREYQTWDGTDANNKLVPAAIYRFAIDAYFDHTNSSSRDTAGTAGWFFALDKRIVDITTEGISESNALAKIKYTLSEPANVKVKICKSGTTFSTDSSTGEATPNPSTNLVKTFTFYQPTAGEQTVTWDGNDEGGKPQSNGLYLIVITATDVEGNKFFNTTGTDNLSRSTLTIDKTSSQVATDSTAPTVVSTTPSNGTNLNSSFTSISAKLQDETGGSGIDLTGSVITLSNPNGNNIAGTQSNDAVDTITLTFADQTANGTYTIRVTPKDKAGNTGAQATYTFTLNTSLEEKDFKDTVFVYPNPSKGRTVTFAYTLIGSATTTIEVFTILGEKVWSKVINDVGTGNKTVTWNCVNDDGQILADELYIYKIKAEYSSGNTRNAAKKLIITK